MSRDIGYGHAIREICEAIGCYAQATDKIQVKIGDKGKICLYLCNNCIGKFAES